MERQKSQPSPRKGMPDPKLDEPAFKQRYIEQFRDPGFDSLRAEIGKLAAVAWNAYRDERKSPQTVKAGTSFADPDYDLSVDWLAAYDAVASARADYERADGVCRMLVINASPRSEHTCPGEMSKSWRLAEIAGDELQQPDTRIETLDLSRLASEYGRNIHPCKACFSTAAPLCHFPCSCYPNHSLGQTQDWMNDIYPMWIRAHGIFLITPVNWYMATSPLKLMMDRMVCMDGGNPDPTSTQGKDAAKAKAIELAGWDYPRPLEGRQFAVVVHGDTEGAKNVRRSLSDWLATLALAPAGPRAELDRYIGYFELYATSHEALDRDKAVQEEVRNAARTLLEAVRAKRAGKQIIAGSQLKEPRDK
ncbi:multimeric flavodoxin WrbA [Sphingopyxis sp. OAS728]|uniref:flavodoxin family protein n=1 Tax=Sphingopyxis sp. OAS728 TaxID=2663823 RepID=UPI0019FDD192|nr:flavodoxin family protein [Sphingopyxis sp. OAS728]MBE1529553.1 multimeric flavodoxin WrbA [Sphingopyxis sp. OAS728]